MTAQQNPESIPFRREEDQANPARPETSLQKLRARNRMIDYVWLVYSVFFFVQPVQQHTLRGWLTFAIFYSIFIALYVGLVHLRRRALQVAIFVAMAVLGVAYMPLNPGALGVFIYIASFFPFAIDSIPASLAVALASALLAVEEGWRYHLTPWSWGIVAFFALAVGIGNTFAAQAKRNGQKLVRAHQELAELAKVAERERIARDLHDLLGHTLSVVVLKSELAGRLFESDPARARIEIGEVEHIARQSLQQVREAVLGYRSKGLAAEISNAGRTLASAGVELHCGPVPSILNPAEETVLSLVLREAVTNILRHAAATECHVSFLQSEEGLRFTISDNGRGGIRAEGNGLRGMRERVQMLGGNLQLQSSGGTTVVIEIPSRIEAHA